MRRILHVLSQRPLLTGSGITLDALVREAAATGWDQCAVVGTPAGDPQPMVGALPTGRVHPLRFETEALPFALPGMSDVMPYPSSRFSDLSEEEIAAYRETWVRHLATVERVESPDIVHVHHAWILASLVKDVLPNTPVVTHCHATGMRQMELCPHLADSVRSRLRRNERFLVLHEEDRSRLATALELPRERIRVVGAGYRDGIFHSQGRADSSDAASRLLYVGKYSRAKGLPWLLDAVEQLALAGHRVQLHVAGGGSGEEANELESRMLETPELVVVHGALSQRDLADLMRSSAVCVLPSFYEGLPLVLVEAAACGCRLVATELPGVVQELAPHMGSLIDLVALPRLDGLDRPVEDDLPAFVTRLVTAIERALERRRSKPFPPQTDSLRHFTWASTFARIEAVWKELLSEAASSKPATSPGST